MALRSPIYEGCMNYMLFFVQRFESYTFCQTVLCKSLPFQHLLLTRKISFCNQPEIQVRSPFFNTNSKCRRGK
jgi:hypothetical protein